MTPLSLSLPPSTTSLFRLSPLLYSFYRLFLPSCTTIRPTTGFSFLSLFSFLSFFLSFIITTPFQFSIDDSFVRLLPIFTSAISRMREEEGKERDNNYLFYGHFVNNYLSDHLTAAAQISVGSGIYHLPDEKNELICTRTSPSLSVSSYLRRD